MNPIKEKSYNLYLDIDQEERETVLYRVSFSVATETKEKWFPEGYIEEAYDFMIDDVYWEEDWS